MSMSNSDPILVVDGEIMGVIVRPINPSIDRWVNILGYISNNLVCTVYELGYRAVSCHGELPRGVEFNASALTFSEMATSAQRAYSSTDHMS